MRRSHADPVDGVLVLDKPAGISSNHALQRARVLLQARKAGHTGTLDPLASGVLPVALGEATKFTADLLEADKEYEAVIALGATTSTGDAEGEVIAQAPVQVERGRFEAVLAGLRGAQQQVPPMHSALKRDGRPLYALARAGITVERAARAVRIDVLELVHWDRLLPQVRVRCSKGTYVRVLAQDIGAALGCGAHLHALRRTAVGALHVGQAVGLAALEGMTLAQRRAVLLPADALLAGLPAVRLDEEGQRRFGHGQELAWPAEEGRVRVYGPGQRLLGTAQAGAGRLAPVRLVAQDDAGAGDVGD